MQPTSQFFLSLRDKISIFMSINKLEITKLIRNLYAWLTLIEPIVIKFSTSVKFAKSLRTHWKKWTTRIFWFLIRSITTNIIHTTIILITIPTILIIIQTMTLVAVSDFVWSACCSSSWWLRRTSWFWYVQKNLNRRPNFKTLWWWFTPRAFHLNRKEACCTTTTSSTAPLSST